MIVLQKKWQAVGTHNCSRFRKYHYDGLQQAVFIKKWLIFLTQTASLGTQDFLPIILGLTVFCTQTFKHRYFFYPQYLPTKIVQILVLTFFLDFTITFDSDTLKKPTVPHLKIFFTINKFGFIRK